MPDNELNVKKELLRTLLKCPHGKLEETMPIFKNILDTDPLFAGKCFYAMTISKYNEIRDLEESGISFLLTSPHPEHRDAGRICFQNLEPYRGARVINFIRKSLKSNRQVKGAAVDYLKTLESNPRRFDGAIKRSKDDIHKMYELLHIAPSKRAQTIVFDNKTPANEINPITILRNSNSPEDQAKIIIKYNIPYIQATSVIKAMTPAIWVALIEVMSPSEALNLRAKIEKTGILVDNSIRELYEKKLEELKTDKRVKVSTMTERKSATGTDEKLTKIVSDARQTKIDKQEKITLDTMMAIDCSGSMQVAIELAKRLCPHIAALCDSELKIICFNDTATELKVKGKSFEDYTKAFALIRANSNTSLGSALDKSLRDKFIPEQVVYITDQVENTAPRASEVYEKIKETKFIFVNVGNFVHNVARELTAAGAEVLEIDAGVNTTDKGWYSIMDNLTPLLTKGGYTQLVEEIMNLELPKRIK